MKMFEACSDRCVLLLCAFSFAVVACGLGLSASEERYYTLCRNASFIRLISEKAVAYTFSVVVVVVDIHIIYKPSPCAAREREGS